MISSAAWKHPLEPTSVFQPGAARPDAGAWRPPGSEVAAPGERPGPPPLPGAGPAAIVTLSPEGLAAALAEEPLPALLGQHQRTAADHLPRLPGSPQSAAGGGSGTSVQFGASGQLHVSGQPGEGAETSAADLSGEGAEAGPSGQPGEGAEASASAAALSGDAGRSGGGSGPATPGDPADGGAARARGAKEKDGGAESQGPGGKELSPEEEQAIKELQARDREVRAHEAAHLAAAGGIAKGGASFTFQAGPDGRQYAIGGEVNIDTSPEKDPRATIAKARQIQAAANAPAEPSGQDRSVAAAAAQMAAEAQAELMKQGREEMAEQSHESGKPEEAPRPRSQSAAASLEAQETGNEAATTAGSGSEGAGSAAPASVPAGPDTSQQAGGTTASQAPDPGVAARYQDPHDHPEGPGNCEPCGKLASTRIVAYA